MTNSPLKLVVLGVLGVLGGIFFIKSIFVLPSLQMLGADEDEEEEDGGDESEEEDEDEEEDGRVEDEAGGEKPAVGEGQIFHDNHFWSKDVFPIKKPQAIQRCEWFLWTPWPWKLPEATEAMNAAYPSWTVGVTLQRTFRARCRRGCSFCRFQRKTRLRRG